MQQIFAAGSSLKVLLNFSISGECYRAFMHRCELNCGIRLRNCGIRLRRLLPRIGGSIDRIKVGGPSDLSIEDE